MEHRVALSEIYIYIFYKLCLYEGDTKLKES